MWKPTSQPRSRPLGTLIPASAPASPIALAFNLDEDIHVPLPQEIDRPLSYILQVSPARGDDVDDSEDMRIVLFVAVAVAVVMVMVVVMMVMVMVMFMIMAMAVIVDRGYCRIIQPEFRNRISCNPP